MKPIVRRSALVVVLQLAAFEAVEQSTVHAPESTGEMLMMLQLVLLTGALGWAVAPAFRGRGTAGFLGRAGLTVALFFATYTLTYLYSWHVRPNVGLYREPDWVKDNAGFREQTRKRIEANRWF